MNNLRRVFKYALPDPETPALMPRGAVVLSAGVQGKEIVVWALVDPEAEKEPRPFLVAGTGWAIEPSRLGRFIGTVFMDALVFHVWEEATA